MPIPPSPPVVNPTIISPAEVNTLAFLTPITESTILTEIIAAAESKFLVPVITHPVYDDIFLNPATYTWLVALYIKPYLAFCTKYLMFTQYLTESTILTLPDGTKSTILAVPDKQIAEIKTELLMIIKAKRQALFDHLDSETYPLYIEPAPVRLAGFIID